MHTFHYLSRCCPLMPRRLDPPKDADAAQNVEAGLIFARTRTPLYVPLEEARAREPANGANTIPDTFTTQGSCLPLAFFFALSGCSSCQRPPPGFHNMPLLRLLPLPPVRWADCWFSLLIVCALLSPSSFNLPSSTVEDLH